MVSQRTGMKNCSSQISYDCSWGIESIGQIEGDNLQQCYPGYQTTSSSLETAAAASLFLIINETPKLYFPSRVSSSVIDESSVSEDSRLSELPVEGEIDDSGLSIPSPRRMAPKSSAAPIGVRYQ